MSDPLNNTGSRIDGITIRQGCGYGPFVMVISNRITGEPIPLDGWTSDGSLRRSARSRTKIAEIRTEPQAEVGHIKAWIDAEDTIPDVLPCGERVTDAASRYYLDLDLISPDGLRIPIIFGDVVVMAKGDIINE